MTTISSHILDSVTGDHAAGIRVQGFGVQPDQTRIPVFDVIANEQGRIQVTFDPAAYGADSGAGFTLELLVHGKDYFSTHSLPQTAMQIMPVMVIRLEIPNQDVSCHVPVVLSPHSCTLWWSGLHPQS